MYNINHTNKKTKKTKTRTKTKKTTKKKQTKKQKKQKKKKTKKSCAGFLPSSIRRFGQFYARSLWTAHSGEAFTHRVCPGDWDGPRQSHRTGGGRVVTHPRLQGTVCAVPGGQGYDADPSSPTAPTGGPCDGKLVGVVDVPPPKSAKGSEKKTPKERQDARARKQPRQPKPTGRLRGRVRESTPRP